MKEFINKLIARLEEEFKYNSKQAEIYRDGSDADAYFREKKDLYLDRANIYGKVIRIVNELAKEYNNGWIPCNREMPKETGWYLGYVNHKLNDIESIEKVLWKESRSGTFKWFRQGNDCEVVAWQPLPEPYQPNNKKCEFEEQQCTEKCRYYNTCARNPYRYANTEKGAEHE